MKQKLNFQSYQHQIESIPEYQTRSFSLLIDNPRSIGNAVWKAGGAYYFKTKIEAGTLYVTRVNT